MKLVLREKLRIKAPRPPKASSAAVSKAMRGNKASGTKPELLTRKALRAAKIKGASWNTKDIPGRPDIYFPASHLAVFIHGCFWHRCKKCGYSIPKTNSSYWALKFQANVLRDGKKRRRLNSHGVRVKTLWECDIKKSPTNAVARIRRALNRRS